VAPVPTETPAVIFHDPRRQAAATGGLGGLYAKAAGEQEAELATVAGRTHESVTGLVEHSDLLLRCGRQRSAQVRVADPHVCARRQRTKPGPISAAT
jgi:hypothetical protein